MRFTSLVFASLVASVPLVACRDDTDDDAYGTVSGIVFGIEQRTDPVTGQAVTSAGYEYRFIGWKNFSHGRWAGNAYAMGPEPCSRFGTDEAGASQHVGDGGRARFTGGALPAGGLVVDANAPTATWNGAGFASAVPLVFAIESGYGVPRFDPVTVPVANVTLHVTAPADGAEAEIDGSKDLELIWSADHVGDGRVFVVFAPDDGSDHVRCVFGEDELGAVIPRSFVRDLWKGKLTIASQRKALVTPGSKWMIDVVTTNVVRDQRFVVR